MNQLKKIIQEAKQIAEGIKNVKPSQIRRLYGPVIKIQEQLRSSDSENQDSENQWERELCMLKPRAVYAAAREQKLNPLKEAIVKSAETIEKIADSSEKKEAAKNFCSFMEAVVAYHKEETVRRR